MLANSDNTDYLTAATIHNALEILQDHGLQQLVTFPTRDFNTLDLVSSNKPSTILNVQSIAGISDHDIVCFEVNAKADHTRQIPQSIYM